MAILAGLLSLSPSAPLEIQPELHFRTLFDYQLEVTFAKKGMEGVRIEYRYKNGGWMQAIDTAQSPRVFKLTPQVAGAAEQVELRGMFLEKYQPVGDWSPVYTVLIAP